MIVPLTPCQTALLRLAEQLHDQAVARLTAELNATYQLIANELGAHNGHFANKEDGQIVLVVPNDPHSGEPFLTDGIQGVGAAAGEARQACNDGAGALGQADGASVEPAPTGGPASNA